MAGKVEQQEKDPKMEAEGSNSFLGTFILCSYSITDIVVVAKDDRSIG